MYHMLQFYLQYRVAFLRVTQGCSITYGTGWQFDV